MKSHREMYPEQYTHSLVGKRVRFKRNHAISGVVKRVMGTQFGMLVDIGTFSEDDNPMAFAIGDMEVVEDE